MVICSLDALKKTSKKKETRKEKEKVKVLQQFSDRRKKTGKFKIEMIKLLVFTLCVLARLILTLTSAFAFRELT